ncbi:MAG TPA: hypothetical protein VHL53_20140 [Acidimicrobiia bacterium]|nr:hypothetical protein [Acidimicrobiia bacterium]
MDASAAATVALADEVRAEAARLAAAGDFPAGYVARARTAAARLSVTEGARDDVRSAALLLEQQAVIDLEVPVASRSLPQRLVKQFVRKLIGWYVRFLGHQVALLGQAAARLGLTVAERLEGLEAEQSAERAATQAEIAALAARVADLEARPRP